MLHLGLASAAPTRAAVAVPPSASASRTKRGEPTTTRCPATSPRTPAPVTCTDDSTDGASIPGEGPPEPVRHGMRRLLLQRQHQRLHPVGSFPMHQRRLSLGDRSRLVEEQPRRVRKLLERLAALDEDPGARRPANGRGDRQRRGQCERAGARHDEQCDRVVGGGRRVATDPEQPRGGREGEHDRDEPPRETIGEQHHRGPAARALLDLPEQAGQPARLAGFGRRARAGARSRSRCRRRRALPRAPTPVATRRSEGRC